MKLGVRKYDQKVRIWIVLGKATRAYIARLGLGVSLAASQSGSKSFFGICGPILMRFPSGGKE